MAYLINPDKVMFFYDDGESTAAAVQVTTDKAESNFYTVYCRRRDWGRERIGEPHNPPEFHKEPNGYTRALLNQLSGGTVRGPHYHIRTEGQPTLEDLKAAPHAIPETILAEFTEWKAGNVEPQEVEVEIRRHRNVPQPENEWQKMGAYLMRGLRGYHGFFRNLMHENEPIRKYDKEQMLNILARMTETVGNIKAE